MGQTISLRYCEDYTIKEIDNTLTRCFNDLGGLNNFIKPKTRVMLKCNLSTNSEPNLAKTTHPSIVIALAEKLAKLGASCIIADCPDGTCANLIDKIYETSEMLDASNQGNAELNLNHQVFTMEIDGLKAKFLTLMDAINDVDVIINIPKLIIDKNYGIKGCMDNLFGLIPAEMKEILRTRLILPKNYYNYLLDMYQTFKNKIVLNVIDAVVISEIDSTPRIMNLILAGSDALCVDAVAHKILGRNTEDCSLFIEADKRNMFDLKEKLHILGEKVENCVKADIILPEIDVKGEKCGLSLNQREKVYHNYQARPSVDVSKCKGCKRCFDSCPSKAISEGRDKYNEIYAKLDINSCINCFRCVRTCPYQAINIITPIKYKTLSSKLEKRMVDRKKKD